VIWDKPSILVRHEDWANLTIKVRKADGSPMSDGTRIYFDVRDPSGNPNDILRRIKRSDGTITTASITSDLVHNGEVKLQVAHNRQINPDDYPDANGAEPGDSWPDWTKGHPHLAVVGVCMYDPYYDHNNSNFSNCSTRIGPEPDAPRLYLKDIFRLDVFPQWQNLVSGGSTYTADLYFYDRAGLPVPDQTFVTVNHEEQYKYSTYSIPTQTTGNKIQATIKSSTAYCWGANRDGYHLLEKFLFKQMGGLIGFIGLRYVLGSWCP
jgi:hypothetical protein